MTTFNRPYARSLATYLMQLPDSQFNMGKWGWEDHSCGTAACIAGHIFLREHRRNPTYADSVSYPAAQKLGLSTETSLELFAPDRLRVYLSDIRSIDAARVLLRLADAPKVDATAIRLAWEEVLSAAIARGELKDIANDY